MGLQLYQPAIATILILSEIASFSGSLFVCLSYYLLKKKRNFALKMIMYLCIADMISSLGFFMYPPNKKRAEAFISGESTESKDVNVHYCRFQGFVKLTGDISSIVWGVIICLIIFLSVVCKRQNLEKKQLLFTGIGYGIPLLFSLIPLFLKYYNQEMYICTINSDKAIGQSDKEEWFLQLFFIFLPLWFGIASMLFSIFYVFIYMKKKKYSKEDLKLTRRVLYFPFILITCGFFQSLAFLLHLQHINQGSSNLQIVLYDLAQITGKVQGLLNALVFAMNPLVRQTLKESLCCCFVKSETEIQVFSTNSNSDRQRSQSSNYKEQKQKKLARQLLDSKIEVDPMDTYHHRPSNNSIFQEQNLSIQGSSQNSIIRV